jgi:hypothetical protein
MGGHRGFMSPKNPAWPTVYIWEVGNRLKAMPAGSLREILWDFHVVCLNVPLLGANRPTIRRPIQEL